MTKKPAARTKTKTPPDVPAPPAPPTRWADRIVGFGHEAPDQLLANPKNWRIHPEAQQLALGGVLDQVGWLVPIIVNKRTGYIVDGHLRVSLALRNDETRVPVLYVDLAEDEEGTALATIDSITGMAATDREQLDILLGGISAESDAVAQLLAAIRQHEGLNIDAPPSLDALADEHGAPDDSAFWPVIRIQVPPDVYKQFQRILGQYAGDSDASKVGVMLDYLDELLTPVQP